MERFLKKLPLKNDLPTDSNGNKLCRWCNKSVYPPRKTMCSQECVHELKLRISGRYIRDCVYKRDKGICSICNLDTKDIAKKALLLFNEDRNNFLKENNISLKRKIWSKKYGGGLWDADHIVPVKEGGGLCGLDNLRTLCISCHKKVTKELISKK